MVTFALDGGRVYGFDVKATDREGNENGHSAVANVFVSNFCINEDFGYKYFLKKRF